MSKPRRERRSQQERREEAANALLDAAQELISRQGIVRTTMAQIAQRAGYSHGLVNHYFGTKNDLVKQLISRSRQRYNERFEREARGKNGLERLLLAVDEYLKGFETPDPRRPALLVMWGSAIPAGAPHKDVMIMHEKSARDLIKEALRQGISDGSISAGTDVDSFAVAMLSMFRGCAAQFLLSRQGFKPSKVRSEINRMVTAALAP